MVLSPAASRAVVATALVAEPLYLSNHAALVVLSPPESVESPALPGLPVVPPWRDSPRVPGQQGFLNREPEVPAGEGLALLRRQAECYPGTPADSQDRRNTERLETYVLAQAGLRRRRMA